MSLSRAGFLAAALTAVLSSRPARAAEPKTEEALAFDLPQAQARCAHGALDVDALLRESAGDKTLDRALFGDGGASRPLDDYLLCRTLAGGRDPLCGDVPARADFCRDEAAFLRFLWAAIRTSDGPARCRETLPPEARGKGADFCALLSKAVREGTPPAESCAAARSAGLPPELARSCEADLAFVAGAPKRCAASDRDSEPFERCRRRAALVAALRAGKQACDGAPDCAALSGGADACEPVRREATAAACRRLGSYLQLEKSAASPKGYSERDRKARDPEEVARATRKKRADDDAAHGAALKKAALDKVRAADQKRRERDAKRAVRTFRTDQPMQDLPPDVRKQMEKIEEQGRRQETRPPEPRPQ